MNMNEALFKFLIHLGDNALILGHRLSEWCGHGPILEQDIALTNISLDFIGQARLFYQYAAELEGKGRTEDDLAYLRYEREYTNCLIVEQPNGHWGKTIMRQFLYDIYNQLLFASLSQADDPHLSAIAQKSLKEINYHCEYSTEWLYRLSGGSSVGQEKMQSALNDLYHYTGELIEPFEIKTLLRQSKLIPEIKEESKKYFDQIHHHLEAAGLKVPYGRAMQTGGRKGLHTEHMGYILTELQYMQRAYPNMEW